MRCGFGSNGGDDAGSSGPYTPLTFLRTTVGVDPQSIPVAQLVTGASGNGVKLRAGLFALGNPISGPDQLAYDFWAFAARLGASSGAVQYGDINSGGVWVAPTCTVNASHVVLINFSGIVALTIDWIVVVEILSLRGAVIL